jgi:hypothetical protein
MQKFSIGYVKLSFNLIVMGRIYILLLRVSFHICNFLDQGFRDIVLSTVMYLLHITLNLLSELRRVPFIVQILDKEFRVLFGIVLAFFLLALKVNVDLSKLRSH